MSYDAAMTAASDHPPTPPRLNRQVRSRRHPSRKPAPEPDLHRLLGLDAADPVTAYELDMEERCPEVAHEIRAERYAAIATTHLLRLRGPGRRP